MDEIALYASGLALLEQNLLTLESHGCFDDQAIDSLMIATRAEMEWYFKQLDHAVGISFKSNFHFALVGHLVKGFRHPSTATVARTARILTMLLDIVAKPGGRDKFEVTKDNVAYLAALVSVSEDVRSRCHVKHAFSDVTPDSPTLDNFAVDNHLKRGGGGGGGNQRRASLASPANETSPPDNVNPGMMGGRHNQRQKSLDMMEQPPGEVDGAAAKEKRPNSAVPGNRNNNNAPGTPDDERQNQQHLNEGENLGETDSGCGDESPPALHEVAAAAAAAAVVASSESSSLRPVSVSNDNNILLDPEVLNDQDTQVLVLTVMATLVKYTTDESEVRILYEYLAEASVVFPRVFPVIHSLLDAKITNVLSLCHDKTILAAVQSIIENMIACEESDRGQHQLLYLQGLGFGGLWRFAGPFNQANCNPENVELFLNTLEALVETCLPADRPEEESASFNSLLSVSSNMKLSSSLTSLSLGGGPGSPTEKATSSSSQNNNPF